MKNLNDFVKDNSKFLRLASGESFEGTYLSFNVATSTFDPEKETVVYKLAWDDGKPIYFQTASVAVARTLSKFTGGEKIRIKREGSGTKTKYHISSPDVKLAPEEQEAGEEEIPF